MIRNSPHPPIDTKRIEDISTSVQPNYNSLRCCNHCLHLVGRLIQGVGAAGAYPIVVPLVCDMFPDEEEVSNGLGMIETANTFGKVISPILGSALALVIWFLPLAVIPVISLLSILAVIFFVKAPKPSGHSTLKFKPFPKTIKTILSEKQWLYIIFIIGGSTMFIMFSLLYYLSSTLEGTYHIHGIWKGTILAIPLCAICGASYLTGKWIGKSKFKMKWFTFSGLGIGLSLPSLDALITEGIEKKQRTLMLIASLKTCKLVILHFSLFCFNWLLLSYFLSCMDPKLIMKN